MPQDLKYGLRLLLRRPLLTIGSQYGVALALLQIAIALLACLIPAYKATKVDPTEALLQE